MHAKFFVVWGMHRSGTSLLAAAMRVFGAELTAKTVAADRFNPKGYFENTELIDLNDAMLAELGQKWHSLAPIGPEQQEMLERAGYVEQAVAFLKNEAQKAPLVMLKDPRMCRLGNMWHQAFTKLGIMPYNVIVWRDPLAVARSLSIRSQNVRYPSPAVDERYGLLLWLIYTQGALNATEGFPRCLVNYDQFLSNPAFGLERISAVFGLPLNPMAVAEFCQDFVDESLNHYAEPVSRTVLPKRMLELKTALESADISAPPVPESIWPVTQEEQTLAILLDEANRNIRSHAAKMASIHAEVCVITGECKRMAVELAALKGMQK